jgi:glycosyltransferase involved in cell wall biosynthesis
MQNIEVSVIVCTYNRDKYLSKTLDHLKNQSLNKDQYEIVIVNNNSRDNTENICKKFLKDSPELNVKYVNETSQGHSYSRNRGIKEAAGSILSFIDDDAFVDQDFIKHIHYFFETYKDATALGGKIIPVYESKEPLWMSRYLLPLVAALDMGGKVIQFEGRKFPIGANMSFRSFIFEKYGLFNVNLGRKGAGLEGGDEKEVFLRLKKQNEPVYYVPQVLVHHIIPDKRISTEYIKGLAVGVGSSEKTRLNSLGLATKVNKILEEIFKLAASLILALKYLLTLHPAKAWMLIRFRFWVWKGLFF